MEGLNSIAAGLSNRKSKGEFADERSRAKLRRIAAVGVSALVCPSRSREGGEMIDRLLSGTGAFASAADRAVRVFIRAGRASPYIAALVLGIVAVGSFFAWEEATDNPNPRAL